MQLQQRKGTKPPELGRAWTKGCAGSMAPLARQKYPKKIHEWGSGGTRDPAQGYRSVQTPHFSNIPPP